MNIYSLPQFVCGIVSLFLGLYVLSQDAKSSVYRGFFFWTFFTFVWQFCYFIAFNASGPATAEFWLIVGSSGVCFVPVTYHHFVVKYLGAKYNENIFASNYFIALIFAILLWTGPYFLNGVRVFSWGYFGRAAYPIHPIFVIFTSFHIIGCIRLTFRALRDASLSSVRRNQLMYFMLATVSFPLSAIDFLVIYGVPIYPFGVFAILFSQAIITTSMARHRLLEVKFFVRRFSLLVFVYVGFFVLSVPFIFLLHSQIVVHPSNSLLILMTGVGGIATIVSMGPFIYAHFVRRNSYFREDAFAGMTHELKTPLGAIQSSVEMIRAQLQSSTLQSEGPMEYLSMIERNSRRMEAYVKDLLSIAQIQDGDVPMARLLVDLEQAAFRVIDDHRPLAEQKNLDLRFVSDGAAMVTGDEAKLRQIFSNLISNAIRYSDHGEICVTINRVGSDIQCTVKDYGRGIDSKHLSKIFNRFYQVNPNTNGSGIGLAIAKAWVEAHGGRIWAESEGVGKGTTVVFTVPEA